MLRSLKSWPLTSTEKRFTLFIKRRLQQCGRNRAFSRSHLVYLGEVFPGDGYPMIDFSQGARSMAC